MNNEKDKVCEEITRIMQTYREQSESSGGLGTPGGLEHMGDVWRKLAEWDSMLTKETTNDSN